LQIQRIYSLYQRIYSFFLANDTDTVINTRTDEVTGTRTIGGTSGGRRRYFLVKLYCAKEGIYLVEGYNV